MAILHHLYLGESSSVRLVIGLERQMAMPVLNRHLKLFPGPSAACKHGIDDTSQQQGDLVGIVIVAEQVDVYLPDIDFERTLVDQGERYVFTEVVP